MIKVNKTSIIMQFICFHPFTCQVLVCQSRNCFFFFALRDNQAYAVSKAGSGKFQKIFRKTLVISNFLVKVQSCKPAT